MTTTKKQQMTRDQWQRVLSAISSALDNDPEFMDDEGHWTDEGHKLRQAYSIIYRRFVEK